MKRRIGEKCFTFQEVSTHEESVEEVQKLRNQLLLEKQFGPTERQTSRLDELTSERGSEISSAKESETKTS